MDKVGLSAWKIGFRRRSDGLEFGVQVTEPKPHAYTKEQAEKMARDYLDTSHMAPASDWDIFASRWKPWTYWIKDNETEED